MDAEPIFQPPPWWGWDVELTAHLLKRMVERRFSEVDLRVMLEAASDVRPAGDPGRWIVETRHGARAWRVVVETDEVDRTIVIVTAYPVDVA